MSATQSSEKAVFHVFGWLLAALTAGGLILMSISGMFDRLGGVPGVYNGMEKESDLMTAWLIIIPLLPLWVGAMLLLRKAARQKSGPFDRIVYGVGLVGIVGLLAIVARLATLG